MSTTEQATEQELRELVTLAGYVMDHRGLVDYLGHASARIPGADRIVIKPKHSARIRSMRQLGPEDMIVVDLDGEQLSGQDPAPSERFIHTEIYRARPDVGGIVHTHQPAATLLGMLDEPLRPLLHIPSTFVREEVARWECALLVTGADRGKEMATALGDASILHLVNHGLVCVAEDVRRATVTAVMVEELAVANLEVLRTGRSPRVIPDDERRLLIEESQPITGRWAYYLQQAGVE